jgi:hypothetical protein
LGGGGARRATDAGARNAWLLGAVPRKPRSRDLPCQGSPVSPGPSGRQGFGSTTTPHPPRHRATILPQTPQVLRYKQTHHPPHPIHPVLPLIHSPRPPPCTHHAPPHRANIPPRCRMTHRSPPPPRTSLPPPPPPNPPGATVQAGRRRGPNRHPLPAPRPRPRARRPPAHHSVGLPSGVQVKGGRGRAWLRGRWGAF